MAKAALEMAVLDAELRAQGVSFGEYLGAVRDRGRLRCLGRHPRRRSTTLLDAVDGYLDEGYRAHQAEDRAGLGRRAGRAPSASASATIAAAGRRQRRVHARTTRAPAPARRVRPAADRAAAPRGRHRGHAVLARSFARRSASTSRSSRRAAAADAIALGACPIVNIKAGPGRRLPRGAPGPRRVRGARRPVWCGGMLETGLGRAPTSRSPRCPASPCPATPRLPTATSRTDITEPFVLEDGQLPVPPGRVSASRRSRTCSSASRPPSRCVVLTE